MKIRFNQPKYMLPLIVLPFVLGIFYVVNDTFAKGPEDDRAAIKMEEINSINPSLPVANLDKKQVKDKFDSFKDAFKTRQDYTAIRELEIDKEVDSDKNESLYSSEEKALIDSINTSILNGTKQDFATNVKQRTSYGKQQTRPNSSTNSKPVTKKSSPQNETETAEEREMRLFKQQMMLIDSLTKTPEQREAERLASLQENKLKEERERQKAIEESKVPVSKTSTILGNHFNTITKENKGLFIRAILDEELKVYDGSRIRIRLMDDITAGGYLVEKGTYVYATVTGFGDQRVRASISSIVVDDQILPVELLIYDIDGMEGIFVPESKFRDFSKDLAGGVASGSSMRIEQDPNSATQFFYGVAQKAMTATTRAAGKAAKRNRAQLKYNTIIYLVNPEDLKK